MTSFKTEGIALVTGAAKGIGQGAANALAEAGASVVIFADIDDAGARDAAEGSKKIWIFPGSVDNLVEKTAKEFGRIDYLVNSAGIDTAAYAPVPDNDMVDFEKVLAVNMKGILHCTRAVVRIMEKQTARIFKTKAGAERSLGVGSIVNITSALSYAAVPGKVSYIASKHAAIGITKAAAQDVKGKGIRVNAICPSRVRTPMYSAECKKYPPVADLIKAAVPLGRPAEPEEVGDGVVYLCSPAASYVNGIGLIMDAGLTLTVHLGI